MKTKAEIIEILKEFTADFYLAQGSRISDDEIRDYTASNILGYNHEEVENDILKIIAGKSISDASAAQAAREIMELLNKPI